MPFVILNAADEKNRQGSTIPLRHDLANDLTEGLAVRHAERGNAQATQRQGHS
jgi:hypothetical protein